ncbi:MAG: hypothetical protein COU29_00625 [Candidatus Magasanikbacteria bacterium CG10_big_fil_rev_8_21_14_0_10_36_32]|uniref:Uncharacterized protein n=1 Tax=Candidatus Magasanikbacteria bacterium CG10_big_fil_rev_8_21_14_0_10_36_32 TaxID=1974646 RepID=A0A2M6W7J0_9BACT|nr:MAG: hypothetical protein COU29_00625 [Candidatus Magasanikbacteria bacterium CG10_big_fil_rev_8_21_14_0_10_36_32]
MQRIAKQIQQEMEKANKIVIVTHPHPDGDTLGSANALLEHLTNLGHSPTIFCVTPASPRLKFLPNFPQLENNTELFNDRKIDLIVVMDCGDLHYAGIAEFIHNHPATIINIDHHATNENYGHYNMVMKKAAATAEVLYQFFQHNRIRISPSMATALLSGLITDTDNFTNGGTSPDSFTIAGDLVRLGANFNLIYYYTQKEKTINSLKLWGIALARLTKNEKMDLAHTYLTLEDFKKCGAAEEDGDGISNFLNILSNTQIALMLREIPDNKIKGNLRTTGNTVDVSSIARKLGGGGHKKAAGFTADGTIEEVLNRILTLD